MEPPKRAPTAAPSIGAGIAFLVLGLVVFVPSGLCTGTMLVGGIFSGNLNAIVVPLVIGGPFMWGGGTLLWLGFKNIRGYFRKSDAPDQF
jgi:hypothetical protein